MIKIIKICLGYAVFPCIILSGLILNILQLITFCLIRPINQSLFRLINHTLQYSCWSQTVAVVDWCCNVKTRITYKDEETKQMFGQHSGLVIANHRYDVDWLAAWTLSDKLGILGNDKAILKSSLRYIPIMGWGWSLSDMIFVSRDWNKDKELIQRSMDTIMTYKRSLLLAYFEGTRFTEAKHEASIKFAEERNIPLRLKYHLLPRVRGFHLLVQRIKLEKQNNPKTNFGVYNFQVGIKGREPISLTDILSGQPAEVHVYIEKLNVDKIPSEDEKDVTKYLYDLFEHKDKLQEEFVKTGQFPGIEVQYKKRILSLINWAFWMLVVYISFLYNFLRILYQGFTDEFTTSGIIYIFVASLFMTSILYAVRVLVNSTKVSRSSDYGVKDKKST